MSLLITAAVLIFGMSIYSYLLVRRATHVQHTMLIPFLYRVHAPNALEVLTAKEHCIIHNKVDSFNLRIIICFVAVLIAVCMGAFFMALVTYEGDGRIIGSIMAIAFAYVLSNYNISSTVVNWIREVENDILARIIANKSEAAGFTSLSAYLEDEDRKMFKEMKELAGEFEEVAMELGFDPKRDYEETRESYDEFLKIMNETEAIMRERHPDPAENHDESL
ncbi:hypothetical protein LCGC14_1602160 [marine sediment metagenome]|uniref:Uncharacterized protein n=1 Tax=marine sediment metagenome TaxID=412755 RepID=A0A0F9LAV9_9ZZZZ